MVATVAAVALVVSGAEAQLVRADVVSPAVQETNAQPAQLVSVRDNPHLLPVLEREISLDFHNASLETALRTIAERARLKLSYDAEVLPSGSTRINLRAQGITAGEAFLSVLRGKGLDILISRDGMAALVRRLIGPASASQQEYEVTGTATDVDSGSRLFGVQVVRKNGDGERTITGPEGYRLRVPSLTDTLVFTLIGYESRQVPIDGRRRIDVSLTPAAIGMAELVVVGYGVQRRGDVTGSVASISEGRLDMAPNLSVAQAIQGALPGVMIQTSRTGAEPDYTMMVRGRNSITADNAPLIVVDDVQFSGNLTDINPNDVESIEILKDASAAAIYGSRGSNGVILITTKRGLRGRTTITYDTRYSSHRPVGLPDIMTGEEFYDFKQIREPGSITQTEQQVFDAGEWVDWPGVGLRDGRTIQHNLSISGGDENLRINYYIAGGLVDVDGLAVNDGYRRYTGRMNVGATILDWLSFGSRTFVSIDDRSGEPAITEGNSGIFKQNPLTRAFDEEGKPSIYIWPEFQIRSNPLEPIGYDNDDESRQIVSTNYAVVDVPFIPGLSNRISTGVRYSVADASTYRGRDTKTGFEERGSANLNHSTSSSVVLEDVLTYSNTFGRHGIFATGVLSSERETFSADLVSARGFPNDLLTWRAIAQAEFMEPETDFLSTTLLSQMLRLNYTYDDRYLLTLTVRRDGYSGFGERNKWGTFPSLALAWNVHNEAFWRAGVLDELKIRASMGANGNQAVGAYETIARMAEENMVSLDETLPGFVPGTLAQQDLGWETSRTLNLGLDFSLFRGRLAGALDFYQTQTRDLLLDRTISLVHGVTSITQNIGETRNRGLELGITSRNVSTFDFQWTSRLNISANRNEIVDLYGDGQDDIANAWFIGKPIRVHFDYVRDGVWQQDEAEAAAAWGSQPGFLRIRDVDADGQLTEADRQIIGQEDPTLLWGMSNEFAYRNLRLNVFVHGVHGVTKQNPYMRDNVADAVHRNATKKNWWTPENPTNEWVMNHPDADQMAGRRAPVYQDASFVRLKDVSLSYDIPTSVLGLFSGVERLRLYAAGRNLHTFTNWTGVDPGTDSQIDEGGIPLQKEFVLGATVTM